MSSNDKMYKSVNIHSRSTYWTTKESSEELIVDSDDLAQEIEKVSNEMYEKGYEILSILSINSGTTNNGNGYYQTESIIITGKRIAQNIIPGSRKNSRICIKTS